MALNWKKNDYFALLMHGDKRSHAALEMFVDDLHADKESSIGKFLSHSGSEDFLWGLVKLLGNSNSRVAGNAAYILGTLAESELGCLRVISLTASKSGETSNILTDLTNMLTFEDSESVMNAAGTMGTLAESHEGRQWMLKEDCLPKTLTCITNLLSSNNLWTASNAALVLARLTIAEEGCEQLLVHEDSANILTKLTASLGVDEAGRGMNAAFAIGRLCDMETGRGRLLGLPDSEKMIIALAKMLCCNDAGASKNACFALSCLATNKEGHSRILKNSHAEDVLKTLTELLSAEDAETGWFAAMTLRTLASQPKGCLRLRNNPFILPALQSAEKRDDVSEDLKDEVLQTLSILKRLSKPKPIQIEETGEIIKLSWEEVTTKSGLEVRYQLFEGTKCMYQGKERSYDFRDVLPFTQYCFKVRAYTEGDESPYSDTVTVITEEGVPGPPQNVRILGTTTTLLKVGWEPPLETNGQLKGYYVYNGDAQVEHTHDLSSIISGLTPKHTYEISVCAATSKGKGVKEYTLGCTSDVGAHNPSKPDVLVRGRSEMHVAWRPPEVPQGKLTRYDLSMNGDVIYAGTDLHHTVLRLKPDTEYTFVVSAITTEGKYESKPAKKKTAKDEYEGERAPLYIPPPKKEVQIEEPTRVDVEHKSASTVNSKKRKSIAGLPSHGHGDGLSLKSTTSRSASATSRRRNSQSKEVDSASKKGANISLNDAVDIHGVPSSISGALSNNEARYSSTGVNRMLLGDAGGTSTTSGGGGAINNNILTVSSSITNDLHQPPVRKPHTGTDSARVMAPSGSGHIELPSGDGLLVAVRQTNVPKVAVASRPSVAISYYLQGDGAEQHGRRESFPKSANDLNHERDVSHVFAWENSLRSYTQAEILQKHRVSSSKSRRSEARSEPELPTMYRSATMGSKESLSKPMRHDFPKPKPPSLKPTLGPGKLTKSLEYNSEKGYGTGTVAARSGLSKSSRIRTLQNPEGLVTDLNKSSARRVRSNTWTLDHNTRPRREVTFLELNNRSNTYGSGRTHRHNSDSGLDQYAPDKTDRLKSSWDDPIEKAKRPNVGKRYMDQVANNTIPLSSPINPQWKVDLPSTPAARNHGKFVPMQFRTQPVNIPGGMHRQATNLQLYDRGLKVDFITRSKTDLGTGRQLSRNVVLPVSPTCADNTGVLPGVSSAVVDSATTRISGEQTTVVPFSAVTPFTVTNQKANNTRGSSSDIDSIRSPRHSQKTNATLMGQLAVERPPANEAKLQSAS